MTAVNAYAANTTAIPSTAASLGITNQPAITGTTTSAGSPNARVGTGFDSTPVAGGATTDVNAAINAVAAQTGQSAQVVRAAHNTVGNQFGAAISHDFVNAAGGGAISSALENGVAKIAAFAQNGIKSIEKAIQGDMAANNGQVDPAKMQQYTMQMSTFEMIMQMAAKIQEKQERATQVWLNR